MVHTPRKPVQATALTADDLFLLAVDDDTEEAPWMVMGDPQIKSATGLYWSLRTYAREQRLPWYVGSMLPIEFARPTLRRKGKVAPDVLVSFVPDRVRYSYDLQAEGVFPAFVLEVVSPSSAVRDLGDKYRLYELLGAREYAVFTPEAGATPLQGYRRGPSGGLEPWPLEEDGRLWSDVLSLYFVARGMMVQAMTPQGRLLLSPEQEATARAQAEDEIARLRAELQRHREQT